jgi:hypothetical protein
MDLSINKLQCSKSIVFFVTGTKEEDFAGSRDACIGSEEISYSHTRLMSIFGQEQWVSDANNMWNPLFQYFMLFPTTPFWHLNTRPFRPIEKDVCSDKQLEVIGNERIHAVLKTTNTLTLLSIWCNCSLGSYNLLLCWVCLLFCLSLNSSWNRNLLLVPAEILVFTTSWLSFPMTPTTQNFNDFATLIC